MRQHYLPKLVIALTGLVFSLVIRPDSAQAATYNFSLSGFEYGGTLSGFFTTGQDIHEQGILSYTNFGTWDSPSGEILDYEVTFSGNSRVSAFTHKLGVGNRPQNDDIIYYPDLGQIFWLTTVGLTLEESTQIFIDSSQSFGISAGVGNAMGNPADFTIEPVTISEVKSVPEPSLVPALSAIGLGLFLCHKTSIFTYKIRNQ